MGIFGNVGHQNVVFLTLLCGIGMMAILLNTTLWTRVDTPVERKSQEDNQIKASDLLNGQMVYVSLTTVSSRLKTLSPTIESIISGDVLPDKIYVFLSHDKYLIDEGVTMDDLAVKAPRLVQLAIQYPDLLAIVFSENIGPHRKLLPLLAQKWNEDCAIITIDDHDNYKPSFLRTLLDGYLATNRTSVVALRARVIGFCQDSATGNWVTAPYSDVTGRGQWPELMNGHHEMLLLPTGMGGVLYRPRFFHPVIFDSTFRQVTATTDDLMFRLAAIAAGTPVLALCYYAIQTRCNPIQSRIVPEGAYTIKAAFPDNTRYEARRQVLATWEIERNISVTKLLPANFSEEQSHRLLKVNRHASAKKLSLGSHYNIRAGGNTANWYRSVEHLKSAGIFDFDAFLQDTIKHDRKPCFTTTPSSSYSLRATIDRWQTTQEEYECGIITCS